MAVPHLVLEVSGERARVDEAGHVHWIRLGPHLPGVRVGEYVTVYAGMAIERIDEGEALEQLRFLRDLASGALDAPSGDVGRAAEGDREA